MLPYFICKVQIVDKLSFRLVEKWKISVFVSSLALERLLINKNRSQCHKVDIIDISDFRYS